MVKDNEKRFIPGSNPKWGLELPDDDSNSLVSKSGQNWDNGYNFDEKDDEEENNKSIYDDLGKEIKFDPEAAEKAKKEEVDSEKAD